MIDWETPTFSTSTRYVCASTCTVYPATQDPLPISNTQKGTRGYLVTHTIIDTKLMSLGAYFFISEKFQITNAYAAI